MAVGPFELFCVTGGMMVANRRHCSRVDVVLHTVLLLASLVTDEVNL